MTKEVLESDVGGSCQENVLSVFSFQPVGYVDGMLMVMMEKSPIKNEGSSTLLKERARAVCGTIP